MLILLYIHTYMPIIDSYNFYIFAIIRSNKVLNIVIRI